MYLPLLVCYHRRHCPTILCGLSRAFRFETIKYYSFIIVVSLQLSALFVPDRGKGPKSTWGGGAVFKAYQFILPGGTGGNILVTTVVTKQTYIIKGNINFQNCLEVGLNWSSPQPHPLLDKVMGSRFKTSVSVTLNTVAANWTSRGPAEGDIAEALSLNNPREYEQSIVPGSYGNKM